MIELKLTPEQLQALGLTAEQEVTSETFVTALDAVLAKAAGGETHGQQITDLQGQLTTLTAERDAAAAKLKEIEQAANMSEVEALLADYDLPEESASAMRDLALANRDQAKAVLGGMRKKEPKAENKPDETKPALPPGPIHDPAAPGTDTRSEEEIAGEAKTKAQAAIKKDPKLGWGAAYAQAEKEVRAALTK